MADDMFLIVEDVTGESKDETYKNQCQIQSWNWGMVAPGNFHEGPGGSTGKTQAHDISITMYFDFSTTTFMKFIAEHKHPKTAKIVCRKSGGDDKKLEYLVMEMKPLIISALNVSGGGSEYPMVSLSLNFAEITVTYKTQSDVGDAAPENVFSRDFSASSS